MKTPSCRSAESGSAVRIKKPTQIQKSRCGLFFGQYFCTSRLGKAQDLDRHKVLKSPWTSFFQRKKLILTCKLGARLFKLNLRLRVVGSPGGRVLWISSDRDD